MNPLPRRPFAIAALACALVGPTLAAGASFAQVPGRPSAKTAEQAEQAKAQDAKPAATQSPEQAAARIREQLTELRRDAAAVPAGIPPAEADAAKEIRTALGYILERQLRAHEELGSTREARLHAEERERGWTGFDRPPPYPIQMVDDLQDAAGIVRSRIAALEAGGSHLEAEQARYDDAVKRAEAARRAAGEAVESARDAAARAVAVWRRDVATLDARRAAAWPVLGRLLKELHGEELGTRRAELRLLERQIGVAAGSVRFTEEDVTEARQRAAGRAAGLRKTLASMGSALEARQRERDAASRELARLKETRQADPEPIALAEARLRAADAWLNARRSEMEVLRGEITLTDELAKLWALRLTATRSADADARREAAGRLAASATLFGHWLSYVQSQLIESRMALRDAEAQLARSTDSQSATVEFDRQSVAAATHTVTAAERAHDELGQLTSVLNRWIDELKVRGAQRSLATRALDAWSAIRKFVGDVWSFELFAVEDSVVLDGRTVTTSHGVTVGKSVGALVLFLGGYGVVALATRRLARWLVSRGVDGRLVRTMRRWSLALVAIVLVLFTLNIARIPLTVFAFLGGTLAIAVGFGTQTIFKNLISGMILLLERSVQIGDVVEVEGVSGTVTAVDLRSSTVRGFDGTETIVPNSLLLENKFTNWTHSDRRLRRIVRVGVAYGSPVRQVADILEACARQHGLVLDEPAPRAIFEDFGDSALVFDLHAWIDFRPEISPLVVVSDLRFMIDRRFREAGIVMAFPQRDVHLDGAGPVRVELVRAAGGGTPPE